METNQGQQSVDRWHLHPDDIAARYATDFCQRNSSYQIGSQTYFDLMHEVQQRIDAGIASGKLKLRSWPGRFVLAPSSTITNNTLVDLQDFCDAADVLGIDCPKNACDLAQTFRLQNIPPAPAPALAPPNLSTDALPNSSSTDSASTLQLTETPHARQDRLLALFEAKEKAKQMQKEEYENDDCPACAGTGEGAYDGKSCMHCGGSGIAAPPLDYDD